MSLTVSSGETEYETVPAGQHLAVCYRIIDAGTREEQYKDNPPKKRHSVFLYWELPEVKMADDRPFTISKKYTMTLNENGTLYKDLKTWRGKAFTAEELKGFDLNNILGKTAQVEVVHNDEGRARVDSVFKPDGGVQTQDTHNAVQAFDIDVYAKEYYDMGEDTKAMVNIYETLPEWMQNMLDESFEVLAGKKKGGNAPVEKSSGGLEDFKKDEVEENIPF
tara:strand:- start:828 stop:1490 length:663 start_codon:yes stop_codon:yes gene_type:complete